MLTILALVPSIAFAASALSSEVDPPTVKQSRNGEFMTKYYPPKARARGEQGKVAFQITVNKDGFMTSCVVTQTSGFENLDKETCDFLTKYANVKPTFDQNGHPLAVAHDGFINWRLPPGSKRAAPVELAAALDPDKMICRRFVKTGSKVGYVKQCMTRQEWAEAERAARADVARMQEESLISSQTAR